MCLYAAVVAPVKLLVIVPHPDDEVFGSGGTLLDFLSRDGPCALLTVTPGDAGRNLGPCETREELGALRRQELADCLGFLRHHASAHEQYTFPDGDVAGHLRDITPLIRNAFETYQPEIVLTFPPDGLYSLPTPPPLTLPQSPVILRSVTRGVLRSTRGLRGQTRPTLGT